MLGVVGASGQVVSQALEAGAEIVLGGQLLAGAGQVLVDQAEGAPGLVVEASPELLEGEAEGGEAADAREAREVGAGVAAVSGRGAGGRDQEADRLVVMEGAHRDAGAPGEVADGEALVAIGSGHEDTLRPHAA